MLHGKNNLFFTRSVHIWLANLDLEKTHFLWKSKKKHLHLAEKKFWLVEKGTFEKTKKKILEKLFSTYIKSAFGINSRFVLQKCTDVVKKKKGYFFCKAL